MFSREDVLNLVRQSAAKMKCMYCQGEMKQSTAPFHIDRTSYHLMLDAIHAWVCTQCGEAYFDETEVEAIQKIIRTIDDQTEKITVSA